MFRTYVLKLQFAKTLQGGFAMKKYLYIILLLLTTLNLYTVFAYGKPEFKNKAIIVERVVVKPGDTLWEIAQKSNSDNSDIREYIYEIKRKNTIENSTITPGDTILVPIK